MPTVPTYDTLQVSTGGLPQPRFSVVEAPQAGREAQRIGQSMQQAGGEMARLALDFQQQANQTKVNDAMNRAMAAEMRLTYDQTDGYVHLKGDAALTRPDGKPLDREYQERLKKHLDEIEANLGNDDQRLAFRQQAGKLAAQFQGGLNRHVAHEFTGYRDSVTAGTIDVAQERMATAWGNAEAIQQSAGAIKAATYEQGRLRGLSAAQIEANTRENLSRGHAAALTSAIDAGRMDYAREYLRQYGDDMTEKSRLHVAKLLDEGESEQKAQGHADRLYAEHKGDIAAALAGARATLSGKEEDAVVQRLKGYDAERVALRERDQKDAADEVWRIYAQTGSVRSIPASLRARMDGRDLVTLREAERRAIDATRGKVNTEERDAAFNDLFMDDERIARMRPEQVSDLRRQGFTASQVGQLARRKKALEKDAESVSLDKQQLDEAYVKHRVMPDDKKTMARIAARVEAEVYQAQQQKGRPLDRDEKQKIINRQFLEVDVRHVGTGAINRGDVSYEARKYWEVQNKSAIRVPAKDRERILKDLRAAGIREPSDDQMRALWLEMQR